MVSATLLNPNLLNQKRMLRALLLTVATMACFIGFISAQNCTDETACNYNPDGGPYCVQTEVVTVHTEGDLAGMTTYRVYVLTDTPEDRVSAVFGDEMFPLNISTTTSFYQDALGATTPNGINPILYDAFPNLIYDTWVTIGIDEAPNSANGEGAVATVQDPDAPWIPGFDAGNDLVINTSTGGSWFVTSDLNNGVAGDDNKVLIGQFTTDGVLSGTVHIQVFPEGEQDGSSGDLATFELGQTCECTYPTAYYLDNDGDGYGTDLVEICDGDGLDGYATQGGDCNDNSALAYPGNPNDLVGDGIDGNCDGEETCYRDVDNDGYRSDDEEDLIGSPFNIDCSEFGEAYFYQPIDCDDTNPDLTVPDEDGNCILEPTGADEGCGDPNACNYDETADSLADNCDYLTCAACGNPAACNYNQDALIEDEAVCEYSSCAGCDDPTATNYDADLVIADNSICVYDALLAIGPVSTNYNALGGPNDTYTNEVYALLPPDAIRLKRILGVKGGETRLRIEPFSAVYQAPTCNVWQPHDLVPSVVVDGVTYTNEECMADSWFTIGGTFGAGPSLNPIGLDPDTYDLADEFDSELLASEGDTLGWEIEGDTGGEPADHCAELLGRPGCANSVRIARVTVPLGESFFFQAGMTYEVIGGGERTVTGQDNTADGSTLSDSGGGGEEDPDISDGTTVTVWGCTVELACNYNANATDENGTCEYNSCAGCTYPDAENYEDDRTLDDGSCTFAPEPAPCPSDLNGDGLIGAADLTQLLSGYNGTCE